MRLDELTFSPDGTGLFAPALSAGLRHWPAFEAGARSDVLALPAKVVKRLAFAPDGRTLYAGSDQLLRVRPGVRTGTVVEIPKWAAFWLGCRPTAGGWWSPRRRRGPRAPG